MPLKYKMPEIKMVLYETDKSELNKFILNEKIDGKFTENYLILRNFADDCRYSQDIQSELIRYLLPFYLKTVEQAVIYKDGMAVEVYYQFNSMMFFNQENFESAIGEENYQFVMEYYVNQTLKIMEEGHTTILNGISLFNTTIAFYRDNILQMFEKIFKGFLRIKYSFFRYLSVLLFKESDNLLAINEARAFWTSEIWDFDS